jgi:hypothetical protein
VLAIPLPQGPLGPRRLVIQRNGERQQSARDRGAISLPLRILDKYLEECPLRQGIRYAQIVAVVAGDNVPARIQEWNAVLEADEARRAGVLERPSPCIETTQLHGSEREFRPLLQDLRSRAHAGATAASGLQGRLRLDDRGDHFVRDILRHGLVVRELHGV